MEDNEYIKALRDADLLEARYQEALAAFDSYKAKPCNLCYEAMKRFSTLMDEDNPVSIEVDGQLVQIEYGELDIGILCNHGT